MEPAPNELTLRNRHPRQLVDLRLVRRLLLAALADAVFTAPVARPAGGSPPLPRHTLGFFLVGAAEMARINDVYLSHSGSTDVITFDYGPPPGAKAGESWLRGDVFISLDDARRQARRFRTTWPEELTRYCVHALLHLRGFDDLEPGARRTMKRQENRLVQALATDLPLSKLRRPPKLRACGPS